MPSRCGRPRTDGRLKSKEDVVDDGVAVFPQTLNKHFAGENLGKLVLPVAAVS